MLNDDEVTEHINSVYKDSTIFDLKDALTVISNTIKKKQASSKKLVAQNFNQFVEARQAIDEVAKHIAANEFLKRIDIEYLHEYKGLQISDYEQEKTRRYIRNSLSDIFELESNLNSSISHLEFVVLNEKAFKQYEKYRDSAYLTDIISRTNGKRKDFLFECYDIISSHKASYDDALVYFEYYFRINALFTDNIYVFDDLAVENTLLANIKVKIKNEFIENIHVSDSVKCAGVVIKNSIACKFKNELKTDILEAFFTAILQNLHNQPDYEIFSLYRELLIVKDFVIKQPDEFLENILEINLKIIGIKMSEIVLYRFLDARYDVKEWISEFKKQINMCQDYSFGSKSFNIDNIIGKILIAKIQTLKTSDIQILHQHILRNDFCMSKNNKSILRNIDSCVKYKSEHDFHHTIKRERSNFAKFYGFLTNISKNENKTPLILMKLTRMLDEHPENFHNVVNKIADVIDDPVSQYFLRKIVFQFKNVVLSADESLIYEKYKHMFIHFEYQA